jgi:hypothetical protein
MAKKILASYFHPWWLSVAFASMLGVLLFTHIPQDVLARVLHQNPYDKTEHVLAYGIVAAFLMLSLRRPVRVPLLLALLCVLAAVGALDEMTQPLVSRRASLLDFASDLVGIAAASSVLLVRWLWSWCVRQAPACTDPGRTHEA